MMFCPQMLCGGANEMFSSFDTRRVLCKQQRNQRVKPMRAEPNRALNAGQILSQNNTLGISKKRVAMRAAATFKIGIAINRITEESAHTKKGHASIVSMASFQRTASRCIAQTGANMSAQSRLFWKGHTLITAPIGRPYACRNENTESASRLRSSNTESA